jgi:hypothetical protein
MTPKEFIYKLVQGMLLIAITTLFLVPYLRASTVMYKNFISSRHGKAATIETAPPPSASNQSSVSPNDDWSQKPVIYTADNLGINLPWLNLHNGTEAVNWLNTKYDGPLIDNDLSGIQSMGITRIRSFCQMESIFNYSDGDFILNESYAKNLDDFLERADRHNISVICVMGDGNYEGTPADLDGHMHWDLIQTPAGLKTYRNAYISYINRFKSHKNILMWEMVNEPYGSIAWSYSAKALKITPSQVHVFLLQSYQAIKPLTGTVPVGFSDLEEEQQSMYRLFSDPTKRKALVDDCTDVYAMHIYRASADQVADFRGLTGKPKWTLELGAYNYDDSEAKEHPIPAANELYNTDENYIAVTQISRKLLNSGFSLIMPWGFASNDGMVKHNPDDSHTLLKLAQFMKDQLLGRSPKVKL